VIRFVSLHGADTGDCFALWDTVTDKFLEIHGEQAWEDYGDLIGSCEMNGLNEDYIRRITNMLPVDIRDGSHICPKEEP
jgi:hypothetical protein